MPTPEEKEAKKRLAEEKKKQKLAEKQAKKEAKEKEKERKKAEAAAKKAAKKKKSVDLTPTPEEKSATPPAAEPAPAAESVPDPAPEPEPEEKPAEKAPKEEELQKEDDAAPVEAEEKKEAAAPKAQAASTEDGEEKKAKGEDIPSADDSVVKDATSPSGSQEDDKVWILAAKWLTSVGSLPPIESGERQPALLDFLVFLKNGTVLCETLNILEPGTCKYDESPRTKFGKQQNVEEFRRGCKKLGLPEEDIFLFDQLFLGADVYTVLQTISSLSQLQIAKDKGLEPFSLPEIEQDGIYNNMGDAMEDHEDNVQTDGGDIYQLASGGGNIDFDMYGIPNYEMAAGSLYEMAVQTKLYEKPSTAKEKTKMERAVLNTPGGIYALAMKKNKKPKKKQEKKDIYDEENNEGDSPEIRFHAIENLVELGKDEKVKDLQGGTYDQNMVYEQIMYEGEEPSLYLANQTSSHRNSALLELADTERNYNKVLAAITDVYHKKLSEVPDLVSKEDMNILFSNIFELRETHQGFLALIEVQMQSTTGRMVSGVFRKSLECFRAYAEYCCKMPAAVEKYEELKASSEEIKTLFEKCQEESGQGFPFRVLLNVPLQRVLKYPLLLREIIKGTPDEHEDSEGLHQANDAIQQLARLVNETMRSYETVQAIAKAIEKYEGPPLESFYPFHKHRPAVFLDEELAYKGSGDKDKIGRRHCFLLPAALLVCQSVKSGGYVFNDLVSITEESETDEDTATDKSGKFKFGFRLKPNKDSTGVQIVARSDNIRSQWLKAIKHNIAAIQDSKTKPPPKIEVPQQTSPRKESLATPTPSPTKASSAVTAPALPPKATPSPQKQASPQKKKIGGAKLSDSFQFTPWFAGSIDKNKTEALLVDKPDGTFLIRESSSRAGQFTLAIVCDSKIAQMPILHKQEGFTVGATGRFFDSIMDFVMYHQLHNVADNCPVKLQTPFKNAK